MWDTCIAERHIFWDNQRDVIVTNGKDDGDFVIHAWNSALIIDHSLQTVPLDASPCSAHNGAIAWSRVPVVAETTTTLIKIGEKNDQKGD